jgi:anti-sigma B factor antagonist
MRAEFRIEVTATPGTRAVKVTGELDSGTCEALLEAVEQSLAERGEDALRIDLREVSFIDSTGMRALIQIERMATDRSAPLTLVPPSDDVTELLRIAGIADRMNLVPGTSGGALGPDFSDRISLELQRQPHAPRRARAEIRELLEGRLEESDIATVVLLTSELVTNAVIHPNLVHDPWIGLQITLYEFGVRVEVDDGGEGFDPFTPTPTLGEGGRGLFLVDRCSAGWGAVRAGGARGDRFRVWFDFLAGDPVPASASG